MDYVRINKEAWNKKVDYHLKSEFYDHENFMAGKTSLNDIELGLLGDVKGKKVLHLQCHFGQDSISLARLGAEVTAVDFSDEAINAAKDAAENELHAAGVSDAALERVATADDGDNANSYLSAPIGGTVVRRDVTLGETVSAGDAGSVTLFTIADDSVVWADIAVYKQDLSRIQKQATVVIKSDDGTVLSQSNVAFILPIINETSRTATARVVLENPAGDLRPGQFVTADISVGQSQPVLRVPLGAVQTVENKASVFVPTQGGFKPRAVTLGADTGDYVEIVSGLRAGDRFVSSGAFTLKAQLEKDAFGGDHDH